MPQMQPKPRAATTVVDRMSPSAAATMTNSTRVKIARSLVNDFNRDPVRRASDAAHEGATLTLITGAKFGATPQRRQTLTYSPRSGWVLDSRSTISAGVAYHMLRGADSIDIERG